MENGEVAFCDLVHSAARKQARGHSVGYTAVLLMRERGLKSHEAHLISRAAEVRARMLLRERGKKVLWL